MAEAAATAGARLASFVWVCTSGPASTAYDFSAHSAIVVGMFPQRCLATSPSSRVGVEEEPDRVARWGLTPAQRGLNGMLDPLTERQ